MDSSLQNERTAQFLKKISAETPNLFGGTFTKHKKNKMLTLGSILITLLQYLELNLDS